MSITKVTTGVIEDRSITGDKLSLASSLGSVQFSSLSATSFYSSGNIGIGSSIPVPQAGYNKLEVGGKAGITSSGTDVYLVQNAYIQDSLWKYGVNGRATYYNQNGGIHAWFNTTPGPANNPITWTEVMRIDSSGDFYTYNNAKIGQGKIVADSTVGNLAIYGGLVGGTTNAQLSFFGKSVSNTSQTYEIARISGASFSSAYSLAGGLQFMIAENNGSNVLTLSERMRIDSSGNVGIGTTNPQQKLHIAGTGDVTGRIQSTSGNSATLHLLSSGVYGWYMTGDTSLRLIMDVTERLRLDSSGNVGIGTTSPASKLHISGASGTASEIRITSTTVNTGGKISFYETTNAAFEIGPTSANGSFYIKDTYNSTERLRIDSTGRVAIGTTSAFGRVCIETPGGNAMVTRYNSSNSRAGMYIGGTSGGPFLGANLTHSSGNQFNYDLTGVMWYVGAPQGQSALCFGCATGTAGTAATSDTTTNEVMRITTDGTVRGKSYAQTSTSGTTSIVDTGISILSLNNYRAIYLAVVTGNYNSNGSELYRSTVASLIFISVGWSGTTYQYKIDTTTLGQGTGPTQGALLLTATSWDGTTETTTPLYTQTNVGLRLKISGYASSPGGPTGANQEVYLTKLL